MDNSLNIKIVVASHKPYWMPSDSIYHPVHVGAAGGGIIAGFQSDGDGESISYKNDRYCELTALYWAWKNLNADYIGLVHYRRHFRGAGERGTLREDEAMALASQASIILPRKRHYFISTVGAHYGSTFDVAHLVALRNVLADYSPEIIPYFDKHLNRRSAHIWNMSIMSRSVLDSWCSWLFPILEELESRIDFEGLSHFEARCLGRLSERLLDPWIEWHGINYIERDVVCLEKTKWFVKVTAFLAAKFFGKKYSKSF